MLTSIASEPSESSRVTVASKLKHEFSSGKERNYAGNKSEYPAAARLKLMMIK
jgi:hypothetical protein